MPTIARVDLAIDDYLLTTTAGTTAGVSSALTPGAEYLVLASGNAQTVTVNEVTRSALLVGGTVFGRSSSSCTYSPAPLPSEQNGATAQIGAVFFHQAGSNDQLAFQAWSDETGEGAQFRAIALDLSDFASSDWHRSEGPNGDAITDQPSAGDGWVALNGSGGSLAFTPATQEDWLILASVEAVPQAGVVGANEIAIRLTVDGVTVSGSQTGGDVNGVPLEEIYGYLTHDVVTLSSGVAHTIQIEANGAATGGNIGFRRVRVHAVRAAAFASGAVRQVVDPGFQLTGTTSSDVLPLSLGAGETGDYLLLARQQKSVTYWSDADILVNGAPATSGGYGIAGDSLGLGASNDLVYAQGMHFAPMLADGDTLGVRITKVGGGGSNNFGSTIVRPGGGDLSLIAVRLETPAGNMLFGTTTASEDDAGSLRVTRALAGTSSSASDGGFASLLIGATNHHPLSAFAESSQPDFGRLVMDPILQNVISGPIEAHYPGTSESLPWYCNESDSAVALVERVKRPAVTNGTTVVLPEGAPDMNSVTSVTLEYWDADASADGAWVQIVGTGDVVITSDLDAFGQPFWDLRFLPDPGALSGLEGLGRLRRRWVLSIAGDTTLHVPQKGHGVMVVNEDPPPAPTE